MAITTWSRRRLERAYAHYNKRFWKGKLPTFSVIAGRPPGEKEYHGLCEWKEKRIYVNVVAHQTDRSVRDTLLHEMAHVGAGPTNPRVSHGYKFLDQMEYLLRVGAPVSVGCPEMPDVKFYALAVPSRYPLCRAAAKRLQKRLERAIPQDSPAHKITYEEILSNFDEAAIDGLSWKRARITLGKYNGLLDVQGRPVNEWARGILARGWRRFKKTQEIRVSALKKLQRAKRASDIANVQPV